MSRTSNASKEFKKEIGMTPVELVRHIRKQMAKEGYYRKYLKEKEAS